MGSASTFRTRALRRVRGSSSGSRSGRRDCVFTEPETKMATCGMTLVVTVFLARESSVGEALSRAIVDLAAYRARFFALLFCAAARFRLAIGNDPWRRALS